MREELLERSKQGNDELRELIRGSPVAESGPWAVVGVECSAGWPDHIAEMTFAERQYFMVPATLTFHEALAFRCERVSEDKKDIDEALRFLSVLAFHWGCSVRVVEIRRAGHFLMAAPIRKFGLPTRNNDLEVEKLIAPDDERAALALALLREGENFYSPISNNVYAFLSFYRAIEVALPESSKAQIDWIDTNWRRACRRSRERAELIEERGSVGKFIFGKRRSALAHAKRDEILNPDRLLQSHEFILDTPVIRELARLAVKEAFALRERFD